ncbi:hypothetical protein [Spirillospora sp. NPDC029432]|uniref:hypothetical protein n=1 Tax=Spirillospora sp. NPDC029432 TaxID=3154599 RepID=UPI003456C1FC
MTYSRTTKALTLVPAAQGRPVLAADPDFRAAAGCLGPAVAAYISRREGDPDLVATGYQGRTAADAREVMCVKVAGNDATAAVAKLKETVGSGKSQNGGRPWAELLPGAAVESAGPGLVRLTARPRTDGGARQGVLLTAAFRGDLPDWRP